MRNFCRAFVRAFLMIIITLFLVVIQLLCVPFLNSRYQSPIVRLWYSMMLVCLRGEITCVGTPLAYTQRFYICNHVSYLDILILGQILDCFFVAKSDIASWPAFGFLSKLGGTVFINRARHAVKKQIPILKSHLEQRRSLLLFPEGTSTNGFEILPFKSSLLHVLTQLEMAPIVQPITIHYTHLNDSVITQQKEMDKLAWYGEMDLAPHLWTLLQQKGFQARLVLHPEITITPDTDIKQLTQELYQTVSSGVSSANVISSI